MTIYFNNIKKDGFSAELEAFWRDNLGRLKGRARNLSNGCHEKADDLVSDAIVKVLMHIKIGPKSDCNIEALAFLALRHAAFDRSRQEHRRRKMLNGIHENTRINFAADIGCVNMTKPRDALRDIGRLLDHSTPEMQQIFQDRLVEEKSYAEIAVTQGISESLARKKVQKLRKHLKSAVPEKFNFQASQI